MGEDHVVFAHDGGHVLVEDHHDGTWYLRVTDTAEVSAQVILTPGELHTLCEQTLRRLEAVEPPHRTAQSGELNIPCKGGEEFKP